MSGHLNFSGTPSNQTSVSGVAIAEKGSRYDIVNDSDGYAGLMQLISNHMYQIQRSGDGTFPSRSA